MVVAAVPVLLFLAIGAAGVDFGKYWDDGAMFEKVRLALKTPPTLVPYGYDRPSVTFWMTLALVVPEALHDSERMLRKEPDTSALIEFTRTEVMSLRALRLFLAASAVTL